MTLKKKNYVQGFLNKNCSLVGFDFIWCWNYHFTNKIHAILSQKKNQQSDKEQNRSPGSPWKSMLSDPKYLFSNKHFSPKLYDTILLFTTD